MPYYWGVDSAKKVTKKSYDFVLKRFGKPSYWGRELVAMPDKKDVLTKEEVKLLHNSGTKILPIYSNFTRAVGYRDGHVVAQNAIYSARRLGVPSGKVLFANLEKSLEIDEAWIRGFIDGIFQSGYRPGFCQNPINGKFSSAYSNAVQNDNKVASQTVLLSVEPERGATKARNAPHFRPNKPKGKGNVWGWQYGRESDTCPINTNLVNQQLFDALW